MIVATLAPPVLAILWWLRHTWLVQVLTILVLMLLLLAALCMGGWLIFALISAAHRLVKLWRKAVALTLRAKPFAIGD